jgi:hypothetical protein
MDGTTLMGSLRDDIITETTHVDSRTVAAVAVALPTWTTMKFIKWYEGQLKKQGHVGRISDETMQKVMLVWKQVDTEGHGCDREGMAGMIQGGMICISADGKILSQQAA